MLRLRLFRILPLHCVLLACCMFFGPAGCVFVGQNPDYAGPEPRPESLDQYYSRGVSYLDFYEVAREEREEYSLRRLKIGTVAGEITVDYFQGRGEKKDRNANLILVFPILGGRYHIESYFADYFACRGFDAAIVHRDKDFKKPEQFSRLEDIFRQNVIRDRIALDFFEQQMGKRNFASFGISRGAINAAITAGVDGRLKHNVLALGGSNLVGLFRDSSERGVSKYRTLVMQRNNLTEEQFYQYLESTIRTDPQSVAKHIDARNTLMVLSVMDQAVPFEFGQKLRRTIGDPETVFLASGHYTAVVFTGYVQFVPRFDAVPAFPPAYIETEAMAFYRRAFGINEIEVRKNIFRVLQIPFQIFGQMFQGF